MKIAEAGEDLFGPKFSKDFFFFFRIFALCQKFPIQLE